jgi:nitroimidazol reductase NimA-like FMN-containing flavoprotein (pyridoxamine 5'-phosphate oxidase superfamily)
MYENPKDLQRLQELIDRSYASAGPHLLSIHEPERRMTAAQVAERLQGMRLLVLATVTGDGRPLTGPVDGIFYRGSFYFSSGDDSVRFRHIRRRPDVSATHLPAEELAVTVHGRAVPIDLRSPEHAGFRRTLLDVYVPVYGESWETDFLDAEPRPIAARIDAAKMFAFYMPS